jgi:hypothetical protein
MLTSSYYSLQQKNASLFTADPLVEYSPTDNTIDYVNATVDLLRQYLKLQAARQQQKVLSLFIYSFCFVLFCKK